MGISSNLSVTEDHMILTERDTETIFDDEDEQEVFHAFAAKDISETLQQI